MKKPIDKTQIRKQIESQVQDYLEQGGSVSRVDRGVSGRESADGPLPGNSAFSEGKTDRTYVPDVVAALEARRRTKPPKPAKKSRRDKNNPGRKIPVYDDFGEVVRWVWQDQ